MVSEVRLHWGILRNAFCFSSAVEMSVLITVHTRTPAHPQDTQCTFDTHGPRVKGLCYSW